MKSRKRNAGFTMAELLIVVAIITVLMGIAFIAVQRYYRRLKQFEAESAAKEIFIAAQNHLSAAETEGLLKRYRIPDNASDAEKVGVDFTATDGQYYCVAFPGSKTTPAEMWEVMLPFGAIDETVRAGGSYLIHYDLSTATVLDVFYSFGDGKHFGKTLTTDEFTALMGIRGEDKLNNRRNYTNGSVVGWYGGDGLAAHQDYLAEPVIKVINGNTLRVEVSPLSVRTGYSPLPGRALSLLVTGTTSNAMKSFKLVEGGEDVHTVKQADGTFVVTLDDVTRQDQNFKKVCGSETADAFIPGEDLIIRAVAFDNTILSNVASSGVATVNSLYGSLTGGTNASVTISSFRHLENLDSAISSLDWAALKQKGVVAFDTQMTAVQTTDLDWKEFLDDAYTSNVVYKGTTATASGCYQPVVSTGTNALTTQEEVLALFYEGGEVTDSGVVSHIIRNVKVSGSGNGGLFDYLDAGSWVTNLDLVNFDVSVTGDAKAGALAGDARCTLKCVRAYNDITPDHPDENAALTNDSGLAIQSASGAAGGLVGSFSGSAESCCAALYVKSDTGAAGGLFGTMSNGSVKQSYAGGHTVEGLYGAKTHIEGTADPEVYEYVPYLEGAGRLNVQGATAGGLIGTLSGGTVTDCYTTCSVYGSSVAGGFVGSASGGSTDDKCYCTGLVAGKNGAGSTLVWGSKLEGETNRGAFAGARSGGTLKGCYLVMANYRGTKRDDKNELVSTTEEDYLPALGTDTASGVKALDEDAEAYERFFTAGGTARVDTIEGRVYDPALNVLAEKQGDVVQFGFRKVEDQVVHLGDWPVFETLVVNK